ncbi:hypothetical protein [Nocardia brasiliensis]|uniref:hypothetical protein n=1 Tax=Nocardia brasiliensis TaxID=37326 RepID=UPI00245697E7|nr:hypothetical protein [Nocardia brasiliensis]
MSVEVGCDRVETGLDRLSAGVAEWEFGNALAAVLAAGTAEAVVAVACGDLSGPAVDAGAFEPT